MSEYEDNLATIGGQRVDAEVALPISGNHHASGNRGFFVYDSGNPASLKATTATSVDAQSNYRLQRRRLLSDL